MDRFKQFVDITSNGSDIPILYLECAAFYILSSTVGQFFWMPNIRVRRLNTWFVISSIPGRMRRSTCMNYIDKVLYEAYKKYGELIGKDGVMLYRGSIIEEGTPEGVADEIIAGNAEGIQCYHIMSSEFGDTLKKIQGGAGHYQGGTDRLFSKMYYGERFKGSLSQRGGSKPRFIDEGTYVTMFSSIQEPYLYLSKGMSRQGLLRRMLFAYVKPKDLDLNRWKPPIEDDYQKIWEELGKYGREVIAPLMLECREASNRQGGHIATGIYDEIKDEINNRARNIDKTIKTNPSDANIYRQTQWEYEVKLSILKSIGRCIHPEGCVGEAEDLEYVKNFLERIGKYTEEMIDELDISVKEQEYAEKLVKVRTKIKKAGPDGIGRSDLLNSLRGVDADALTRYTKTLIEQKAIVVKTENHKSLYIYKPYTS